MEHKKSDSGAISPERLRDAFQSYFESRTNEQIVSELNKRAPELLVHFNKQHLEEESKKRR